MSEVQFFHALDHDGRLIGIDTADKEKNGPFTCPHCHRVMVARNVKQDRQRPKYFAHQHIDEQRIDPEGYDHEEHLILQDEIMLAFQRHLVDATPYLTRYHCDECGTLVTTDLTRAGNTMEQEAELEGLRPDLLVRDNAGQVRCVIEVVIKHALSEENTAKYTALNKVVFVVYYRIPSKLLALAGKHHLSRMLSRIGFQ
jgi:predicted RNA-binding Zn-ribbon protein involved in translation (DUF1610 family)